MPVYKVCCVPPLAACQQRVSCQTLFVSRGTTIQIHWHSQQDRDHNNESTTYYDVYVGFFEARSDHSWTGEWSWGGSAFLCLPPDWSRPQQSCQGHTHGDDSVRVVKRPQISKRLQQRSSKKRSVQCAVSL